VAAPRTEIEVFTFKEGFLSRVAHDLKIRVGELRVELADGVRATVDPRSLRVVCAMKKGKESRSLSRLEVGEIERNIRDVVLQADRFPEIVFEAEQVSPELVAGTLQLHGTSRPIELRFRAENGWRVAEVQLDQRDFGITPYQAMMGALRVQPVVTVVVRTRWTG
jgi:hypothetical protein